MRIEVIFALAKDQDLVVLALPAGATAGEAVAASGLLERHGLEGSGLRLGMSGKRIVPGQRLSEGGRVEILRPLAADPNEARRGRARRSR